MWSTVVSHLTSYIGWGLIFIYYLVALVYLFVTEKRKERRILFIYMPLIVLIIFLLPVTAMVMERFADDEVYYRLLWILPISITLAAAVTEAIIKLKGKAKGFALVGTLALIILGGRLIYTDTRFSVAENEYHIPQEVVDICDALVIQGREVQVAFPKEMLVYVRQYTPLIVMPYGWDDLNYAGEEGSFQRIREILEKPTINAKDMGEAADDFSCHYIVLDEEKPIAGEPESYGLEEYMHIDGYVIYKNTDRDFTDPYA